MLANIIALPVKKVIDMLASRMQYSSTMTQCQLKIEQESTMKNLNAFHLALIVTVSFTGGLYLGLISDSSHETVDIISINSEKIDLIHEEMSLLTSVCGHDFKLFREIHGGIETLENWTYRSSLWMEDDYPQKFDDLAESVMSKIARCQAVDRGMDTQTLLEDRG